VLLRADQTLCRNVASVQNVIPCEKFPHLHNVLSNRKREHYMSLHWRGSASPFSDIYFTVVNYFYCFRQGRYIFIGVIYIVSYFVCYLLSRTYAKTTQAIFTKFVTWWKRDMTEAMENHEIFVVIGSHYVRVSFRLGLRLDVSMPYSAWQCVSVLPSVSYYFATSAALAEVCSPSSTLTVVVYFSLTVMP